MAKRYSGGPAFDLVFKSILKSLDGVRPDQRPYRLICELYFLADHIAAVAMVMGEEAERLRKQTRPKLKVVIDLAKARARLQAQKKTRQPRG